MAAHYKNYWTAPNPTTYHLNYAEAPHSPNSTPLTSFTPYIIVQSIDLITILPNENCPTTRQYKFPFLAAAILSSKCDSIMSIMCSKQMHISGMLPSFLTEDQRLMCLSDINANDCTGRLGSLKIVKEMACPLRDSLLQTEYPYINKLLSTLYQERMNDTVAGYMYSVLQPCVEFSPDLIYHILQNYRSFLVKHIYCESICELLITIFKDARKLSLEANALRKSVLNELLAMITSTDSLQVIISVEHIFNELISTQALFPILPEKNIIATLTQNLASECDARRKISYALLAKAAENLTTSECEEFSSQHLFDAISCLDSETTNDCYKDCSGMIVEVAGIEITSMVRLVELLISKESDNINSRLSEAHYGAKLLYVFRSFYHHGLLCQKIKNILCKVITEGRETLVKSLIDDKCIPNDVISLCKSQEYLVNGKVAYKPTRIFLFRIIQRINSSQSSLIRSATVTLWRQ